jgi:enoyl-CoA hydratase
MSSALTRQSRPADGIVELTLDRPEKKNALSIALREELTEILDDLAADEAARVVVLTGAGDTFSAGFDLSEFAAAAEDEELATRLWASSDRYHQRVLTFPLPIVAAINGAALAGGFDLATMCDIRIAGASARFARPEGSFGEILYGPLHDLLGAAVARDLSLTRRSIDADEALRIGLVSRVVGDDELRSESLAVAATIAEASRPLLLSHKAKFIARSGVGDGATLSL